LLGNDWRFVIDFNLNDIDNSKYKLDEHNDIVLNHDKPDVEFNDDGSVHINTPGDYWISVDFDCNPVHIFRDHDGKRWHYDRTAIGTAVRTERLDDPALD
jgi:hypothetical protein